MAALLGTFEQIVLIAVKTLDDQAYGRAILRGVQLSLERTRTVTAGSVYATLDRLEAEGLLNSRLEKGAEKRKGRARRYYQLTPHGVTALSDARRTLERAWRAIDWPAGVQG